MHSSFLRRLLIIAVLLLTVGFVRPQAQASVAAQINAFWTLLKAGSTDPTTQVTYAFTNEALIGNGYISWGTLRGTNGYGIRDLNGTIQIKNNGGAWATPAGGSDPLGTYLVKTATNAPANAQIMAALGTGLVFNTTTTGVQSIYTGTSCTNQFPRSLASSGAATCATVALGTDVSGILLAADFPALTGDITTPSGSVATTLAATGVGAGSVGSATAIPVITFDAKGRATVKTVATPQLTLTSTYLSSLDASTLTGYLASNLSGAIVAANFPALTGDVTNAAGSLATTVGKIGGNAVSLGSAFTVSGAGGLTLTLAGATSLTLPTSGTLVTTTVTSLPSLSTVGTLGTGTWQGTVIAGQYGGTGVANTGKTITLGGSLTTSGAFATTFTMTAGTSVTFPTSGTLLTTTGSGSSLTFGTGSLALGGNLSLVGAFVSTFNITGATTVTFPTTGTLVNTAVTALSSLATVGTIGTGTWNATAITVPYGGCGQTTFTAYAVLAGGTTSTGNCQQVSGVGLNGQVLTSQGAGALPIWTSSGAGTVTNTTGNLVGNQIVLGNGTVDIKTLGSLGTTTTLLHGNAGGTPSFGAVSLSADVTNTLPVANGGSGTTTSAANTFFAGPASGAASAMTFRTVDPLDLTTIYAPVTSQFDTGTTVLANVPGLSLTLVAGKTYVIEADLIANIDTTGGMKIGTSGTASFTTFGGYALTAGNGVALNMGQVTSSGTFISQGAGGVAPWIAHLYIYCVVNAGGTITIQFAQNSASGTSSVKVGSSMKAF